jgi:rod shape-determining protein MreC
VTIAILVLISITIITFDERAGTHHITSGLKSFANDVFSPVRSGVNAVVDPIGNFFAGAVNYRGLQEQNNQLRATIGRLEEQQSGAHYTQRQQEQLDALQNLPFLGGFSKVTATVTSYQLSNFDADIQINLGTSRGVAKGMPVVGNGGLVGIVTQTYRNSAIVTLVTDGQSKVGVVFGPSTCTTCWGIAQGQGPGQQMTVNLVQPNTAISKGETMYTNGVTGSSLPAGIPVATVASYHQVSGESQISIHATPTANLSELAYVDVLLWEPSA